MHATTEQLINFRDGSPLDVNCKLHVQNCDYCKLELSQLNTLNKALKTLPVPELKTNELLASWEKITAGAAQQSRKRQHRKFTFAAIASVMLVGLLFNVQNSQSPMDQNKEQLVEVLPVDVDPITPVSSLNINASQSLTSAELKQLVAYSRLLEGRLQAMPHPRLVRANTAGTISQLEDQISLLDDRLNLDHQIPLTEQQRNALWQQRVNSMNNLYRVRSAQLQRVSF